MKRGLPPEVRQFIERNLESALELEVLLTLHRRATALTAREIAAELRFDGEQTLVTLRRLAQAGVVTSGAAEGSFAVREDRRARAVLAALASAYETHRVAVIEAIFSKPSGTIRGFADAFRLRDGEDGDE